MTALFPGSFDPVTLGHLDIIERAARLADKLIIAVLHNPAKKPLFTVTERVAMLMEQTRGFEKVEVDAFEGLLAVYAKQKAADIIIRGVRSSADYAYEAGMARMNRMLSDGLETMLIPADPGVSDVSGSAVREIARMGYASGFDDAVLLRMVPAAVKDALKARFTSYTHGV